MFDDLMQAGDVEGHGVCRYKRGLLVPVSDKTIPENAQSLKDYLKLTPRRYSRKWLTFLQCHVGQGNLVGLSDNTDVKLGFELRLVEARKNLSSVIGPEVGGSPAKDLAVALVWVTIGEETLDGVAWYTYVAFEENVDLDVGFGLKVLV